MNYLKKKFNGPVPDHIDGVTCEACVYGERWAKHHPACPKADVHRVTAAKALGIQPEEVSDEQRRQAKAINLGPCFGGPSPEPGQSLEEFCEAYQRSNW